MSLFQAISSNFDGQMSQKFLKGAYGARFQRRLSAWPSGPLPIGCATIAARHANAKNAQCIVFHRKSRTRHGTAVDREHTIVLMLCFAHGAQTAGPTHSSDCDVSRWAGCTLAAVTDERQPSPSVRWALSTLMPHVLRDHIWRGAPNHKLLVSMASAHPRQKSCPSMQCECG